jgi:hypothetical protein
MQLLVLICGCNYQLQWDGCVRNVIASKNNQNAEFVLALSRKTFPHTLIYMIRQTHALDKAIWSLFRAATVVKTVRQIE